MAEEGINMVVATPPDSPLLGLVNQMVRLPHFKQLSYKAAEKGCCHFLAHQILACPALLA
eukprot:477995-Pelagomonas_calceolata.AAC.4